MDKERIKEKLYGEQQRQAEEEEFKRRLNSKNMYIPNAGPKEPDWRLAQKVIEILKRDAAHNQMIIDRANSHQEEIDSLPKEKRLELPRKKPVQAPTIQYDVKSIESELDTIPEKSIGQVQIPKDIFELEQNDMPLENRLAITSSTPYVRGDDINQDYFTFLRANIISGKPAKPTLEEDATFYFALRSYANGESIMFKGPARSGKSLLADKLAMLTDHMIIGGASNNALLDHIEEINNIGKVYITEHQSVVDPNPRIKEIVKHLLEDKDYVFHSNGKTKELDGSIQILTTAADENRHTQKIDVELYARYTPFKTTLTPEKIRVISEYLNGLEDGTIDDVIVTEQGLERIKAHFESVRSNETVSFINPFIKSYADHLPETQKSLHSRSLYLGLIKASTKFDSVNRVEDDGKLVTNLSDLYLVHEHKYSEYCENLQLLTAQTFYSHRNNPNELEKSKHEETKEYELNLIDQVRQKPVDWCSIWKSGYELMKNHHPDKLQEWVDLNSKEGMVTVYDPIARQEVEICPVEVFDA